MLNYDTEFNRRRLIRLQQVRHQSKTIAKKICNQVRNEKNKLLQETEKKTKENFKQMQSKILINHYHNALINLGIGQKNAEHENNENAKMLIDKQINKNNKIILKTKYKLPIYKKATQKPKHIKEKKVYNKKIQCDNINNNKNEKSINPKIDKEISTDNNNTTIDPLKENKILEKSFNKTIQENLLQDNINDFNIQLDNRISERIKNRNLFCESTDQLSNISNNTFSCKSLKNDLRNTSTRLNLNNEDNVSKIFENDENIDIIQQSSNLFKNNLLTKLTLSKFNDIEKGNHLINKYSFKSRADKIKRCELPIINNSDIILDESTILEKMYQRQNEAKIRGAKALEKERDNKGIGIINKKLPLLKKHDNINNITNGHPDHSSKQKQNEKHQQRITSTYEDFFNENYHDDNYDDDDDDDDDNYDDDGGDDEIGNHDNKNNDIKTILNIRRRLLSDDKKQNSLSSSDTSISSSKKMSNKNERYSTPHSGSSKRNSKYNNNKHNTKTQTSTNYLSAIDDSKDYCKMKHVSCQCDENKLNFIVSNKAISTPYENNCNDNECEIILNVDDGIKQIPISVNRKIVISARTKPKSRKSSNTNQSDIFDNSTGITDIDPFIKTNQRSTPKQKKNNNNGDSVIRESCNKNMCELLNLKKEKNNTLIRDNNIDKMVDLNTINYIRQLIDSSRNNVDNFTINETHEEYFTPQTTNSYNQQNKNKSKSFKKKNNSSSMNKETLQECLKLITNTYKEKICTINSIVENLRKSKSINFNPLTLSDSSSTSYASLINQPNEITDKDEFISQLLRIDYDYANLLKNLSQYELLKGTPKSNSKQLEQLIKQSDITNNLHKDNLSKINDMKQITANTNKLLNDISYLKRELESLDDNNIHVVTTDFNKEFNTNPIFIDSDSDKTDLNEDIIKEMGLDWALPMIRKKMEYGCTSTSTSVSENETRLYRDFLNKQNNSNNKTENILKSEPVNLTNILNYSQSNYVPDNIHNSTPTDNSIANVPPEDIANLSVIEKENSQATKSPQKDSSGILTNIEKQ